MLCFNCGSPLSGSEFCSNCGIKVTVYKKIIRMSNTYYNMGLVKANNRDLSGAADMLRRSLRLDKRNIKARNLLGLVYYELGETVQALSEWVISQNFKPEKNPANGYIKQVQSNANKLEEMNQNIKKFNIALKYAKLGNDDIAIIQLKKVLSQNPQLVKGHQLLSLLYMKDGEYDKARRAIKKALTIDRCNSLSLKYNREIEETIARNKKNPDKKQAKAPTSDRPYLSGNDVIIPPHAFREPTNGAITILNIIVGIIVGALAMYFIVTPVKVKNEVDKNNEIILDYNQKLAMKNSTLSELERQVENLTKDKEKVEKKLDKYEKSDNSVISNYDNLLKSLHAFVKDNKEESALALKDVNTKIEIDSEVYKSVYKYLHDELDNYLAKSYFNAGMQAYNLGNFQNAIESFDKCLEEDETYVEALYRKAWAYSQMGNSEKSVETFKDVISKFPNSEYAGLAKQYVPQDDTDD